MTIKEARLFVTRFIAGDYTPEEHGAFLKWMEGASFDDLESIATEFEGSHESWPLAAGPSSAWIEQLEQKLDSVDKMKREAPVKRMDTQKMIRRIGWVAAASVVGVLGVAGIWKSFQSGKADGVAAKSSEVLSTVSVPRGEQQRKVVLADGSQVWLNSASSITYPAQFTGKERMVAISGEAYFEVANNMSMPFRVKVRDMQIEVLGTRFNVMAYEEEGVSTTSLLEGAVSVTRGTDKVIVHQGEKAEAAYPLPASGSSLKVVSETKEGAILAWKDGFMDFDEADIRTVMNEVARCYNLEVKYEGNIPKTTYSGRFSRTDELKEILKDLEFQHVHIRIEGKIIRVMP